MEVLLRQEVDQGCVCIARAPDGRYHVLWGDDSLGSADSIAGALVRASAGPLKKARDGTDVVALGVSRDASRWTADDAWTPALLHEHGAATCDAGRSSSPPGATEGRVTVAAQPATE